jgi:hypothetical protein
VSNELLVCGQGALEKTKTSSNPDVVSGEVLKWPQTETEYWKQIAGIGSAVQFFKHEAFHGNIPLTQELGEDVQKANRVISLLFQDLKEKFGVIPPWESIDENKNLIDAPEGKINFSDWYKKIEKQLRVDEYNSLLCSNCPLAIPLDEYLQRSEYHKSLIPCQERYAYGAFYPGDCLMVRNDSASKELKEWRLEMLLQKIEEKAGKPTVNKFLIRWQEFNL